MMSSVLYKYRSHLWVLPSRLGVAGDIPVPPAGTIVKVKIILLEFVGRQ